MNPILNITARRADLWSQENRNTHFFLLNREKNFVFSYFIYLTRFLHQSGILILEFSAFSSSQSSKQPMRILKISMTLQLSRKNSTRSQTKPWVGVFSNQSQHKNV